MYRYTQFWIKQLFYMFVYPIIGVKMAQQLTKKTIKR